MDKNYALQLNHSEYITLVNKRYGASIPIKIWKEAVKILETYEDRQTAQKLKELTSLGQKTEFLVRSETNLKEHELKNLRLNEQELKSSYTTTYDFYFGFSEIEKRLGLTELKTSQEIEEDKRILKEAKRFYDLVKDIETGLYSFSKHNLIDSSVVSDVRLKIKGHYKGAYYHKAVEVKYPIQSAYIISYLTQTLQLFVKEAKENLIDIEQLCVIRKSNDLENFINPNKTYALTAKYEEDYGFATKDYRKPLTKNLSEAFLFSSMLDIDEVILSFENLGLASIVPIEVNLSVNFDKILTQASSKTNPAFEALQALGLKQQITTQVNLSPKQTNSAPLLPTQKKKHKI